MAQIELDITETMLLIRKALSEWLGDVINQINEDKPTVEEIVKEFVRIQEHIDQEIAITEVNKILRK
jgi:hypothetical protein